MWETADLIYKCKVREAVFRSESSSRRQQLSLSPADPHLKRLSRIKTLLEREDARTEAAIMSIQCLNRMDVCDPANKSNRGEAVRHDLICVSAPNVGGEQEMLWDLSHWEPANQLNVHQRQQGSLVLTELPLNVGVCLLSWAGGELDVLWPRVDDEQLSRRRNKNTAEVTSSKPSGSHWNIRSCSHGLTVGSDCDQRGQNSTNTQFKNNIRCLLVIFSSCSDTKWQKRNSCLDMCRRGWREDKRKFMDMVKDTRLVGQRQNQRTEMETNDLLWLLSHHQHTELFGAFQDTSGFKLLNVSII